MTNKDHVYIQPVPPKDKETIIRALKSIIEKIENSDTGFGVLVNYVQVTNVTDTENDGETISVKTHNLLAGYQDLLAGNIARNIATDKDYQTLFAHVSDELEKSMKKGI